MKTEKHLFYLIEEIGETLDGELHIIDTSEEYPTYIGEKQFRVYHRSGICFDIMKKADFVEEDTEDVKTWYYDMYNEWDGFNNNIDANSMYKLIKPYSK